MMHGWDGGMSATGWFFMSLFWVLLVVVIVWAAATLFPGRRQPASGPTDGVQDDPRMVLDMRLARGDIDEETYDRLRARLESKEAAAR